MLDSGVYYIRNIVNNKQYIGSSINLRERWRKHRESLKRNDHGNSYLQRAWNLHGENAFEWGVLEYCDVGMLLIREKVWMDYYKTTDEIFGYNLSLIPGAPMMGRHHSLESCKKMSLSRIGNKNRLGIPHSPESRLKMSIARKKWKLSPETVEGIRLRMKGNKYCLGRHRTEEEKHRISIGHLGKKATEETKRKISSGQKNRHLKKTSLVN